MTPNPAFESTSICAARVRAAQAPPDWVVSPRLSIYRPGRLLSRLMAYAWTAPNSALGILVGLGVLVLGGRMRMGSGVVEFHGGRAGRFFAALPGPFRFGAITLGHVILGTCHEELVLLREHEHVHVRQFEQWGVFFLPVYALSSAWEVLHRRSGYRNNYFERQAYASEANRERRGAPSSQRTARGRP